MSEKICCLFDGKNAKKAMKERDLEVITWLISSYRHDRAFYRCRKCGGLVLFDYEETAHFLPGEDWDNAYVEEYYWPVIPEDIRVNGGEIGLDWTAITARKHISVDYRELDEGEKPYCFVEAKPSAKSVPKEYTKECPATVTFETLPADSQVFSDVCMFTELLQIDSKRNLKVLLPNCDDPQEINVSYQDGKYSMRLSLPMDDYGWKHPLILGKDGMSCSEVKEILTEICVKQTSTMEITAIEDSFRDITTEVFGDESPEHIGDREQEDT